MFSHRHENPKRYAPIRLARMSERLAGQYDEFATLRPNRYRAELAAMANGPKTTLKPANLDTGNELRPGTLADLVGQDELKPLLARLIDNARRLNRPLGHVLLIGGPGTGKTTLAMVIARELGRNCFVLKPPIDMGTLEALRETAKDGDIVFCDEIHQQVHGDRRGITQACDPENLYQVLEDCLLMSPTGPLIFPRLCWVGGTTDAGLLPQALIDRFPIQPHLAPYTEAQMVTIATRNLDALGLDYSTPVPAIFAKASRLTPRQLNSYVKTARDLVGQYVRVEDAHDVIVNLGGTTLDGLTSDMQRMLTFLWSSCRKESANGRVTYSASVNTIATATGHGRDTKFIALMVENYLIQRGFVSVQHGGRTLTESGICRAKELA